MANGRHGHACVVSQGHLYAIGGYGARTLVERMDLATYTWETMPGLDTDFTLGQALVYDDTVYIVYWQTGLVLRLSNSKWVEVATVGGIGLRPVYPAPLVTQDTLGC